MSDDERVLIAGAILVLALVAGTWRAVQILTIGGACKAKVARLIARMDIGARISPVPGRVRTVRGRSVWQNLRTRDPQVIAGSAAPRF